MVKKMFRAFSQNEHSINKKRPINQLEPFEKTKSSNND
jgi:hypothetical protein